MIARILPTQPDVVADVDGSPRGDAGEFRPSVEAVHTGRHFQASDEMGRTNATGDRVEIA